MPSELATTGRAPCMPGERATIELQPQPTQRSKSWVGIGTSTATSSDDDPEHRDVKFIF